MQFPPGGIDNSQQVKAYNEDQLEQMNLEIQNKHSPTRTRSANQTEKNTPIASNKNDDPDSPTPLNYSNSAHQKHTRDSNAVQGVSMVENTVDEDALVLKENYEIHPDGTTYTG